MKLCDLLVKSRENKQMNMTKAAKIIGISLSYLNELEKGRAEKPKMKYLRSIADLYQIDYDNLCIVAGRVPQDVYYKIVAKPELIKIIREA